MIQSADESSTRRRDAGRMFAVVAPPSLMSKLSEMAAQADMSRSRLIREVLRQYVASNGR